MVPARLHVGEKVECTRITVWDAQEKFGLCNFWIGLYLTGTYLVQV